MAGRFITFEGGEGGGKSTHAKLLGERLESGGIDVILTREPGGSPGAEIIRHVLLSGAAKPLGAETETILFAAARDDHVRATIAPALAAGKWVICDRFLDSTRVYQGILGRVDAQLIRGLERVTVGDTMPDLTLILDVPVEVGLERARKRRGGGEAERFEAEAIEFHEKLRRSYAVLAKLEPARCILIDAAGSREAVQEKIWQVVSERLMRRRADRAMAGAPSALP
jgi:dTMP kinase